MEYIHRSDHLAPFLRFVGNEFAEFGGRAARRCGLPSAALWLKTAPWRFARACAGHAKLLSLVPVQHRAATTQTPQRPTGRWQGEE
jgi:hypothetical protein